MAFFIKGVGWRAEYDPRQIRLDLVSAVPDERVRGMNLDEFGNIDVRGVFANYLGGWKVLFDECRPFLQRESLRKLESIEILELKI